jgi:DNA-binding NtrC family response regulator
MGATIVVLDADECRRHNLCQLLSDHRCPSESLKTLEALQQRIAENDILAVIIDIDSVPVDNRTIRNLTVQNPAIYFFCVSERRFHPELEDAICYHIYACINKPIDPDELFFWIDSIRKEGKNT